MNAFSKAQLSYCLLVWMRHSCLMNSKIDRQHERCLRIIYNDKTLCFVDLLAKDGSVTIHKRSSQALVTEVFKVRKTISTKLIQQLFGVRKTRCKLRNSHNFAILGINSVYNSSKNISHLGLKTWKLVPDRLKELKTISSFKNRIKGWHPEICPYRPCKSYIPRFGF